MFRSSTGRVDQVEGIGGIVPKPEFCAFGLEFGDEELRNALEHLLVVVRGEDSDDAGEGIENVLPFQFCFFSCHNRGFHAKPSLWRASNAPKSLKKGSFWLLNYIRGFTVCKSKRRSNLV